MTSIRSKAQAQPWQRLLAAVVVGALPGLVLVLAAQYLVSGEPQLTVGVAGMWLAAAGAVAGFIVGLRRARKDPRGA